MAFFRRGSYETIKNDILKDLSLRKREIDLSSYGQSIFLDAIAEDPRYVACISSIGFSSTFRSVTAQIGYSRENVDLSTVECPKNTVDAEGILQFYLSRFKPKIRLVLPQGIDGMKMISDFLAKYSVLYPGYKNCHYSFAEMPFLKHNVLSVDFHYVISRYQLNQMDKQLNGEIGRLCSILFLPEMPPIVKAYVAHNYLARTVTYWTAEAKTPEEHAIRQSAYGALIEHKCVCQGYAEAFQRLMDAQGIECYVMHGKVYEDPSVHHAWNLVVVAPRDAFHLDATWDSVPRSPVDTYFGMSDKDLTPLREWDHNVGKPARSGVSWVREARSLINANLSRYLRGGIEKKYLVL